MGVASHTRLVLASFCLTYQADTHLQNSTRPNLKERKKGRWRGWQGKKDKKVKLLINDFQENVNSCSSTSKNVSQAEAHSSICCIFLWTPTRSGGERSLPLPGGPLASAVARLWHGAQARLDAVFHRSTPSVQILKTQLSYAKPCPSSRVSALRVPEVRRGVPQPNRAGVWCSLGSSAAARAVTSEAPECAWLNVSRPERGGLLAASPKQGNGCEWQKGRGKVRDHMREKMAWATCMNKMGLPNAWGRQYPFHGYSSISPARLYYKEVLQAENWELEAKTKTERSGYTPTAPDWKWWFVFYLFLP